MEAKKLINQNTNLSEQKMSSFLGGDCLLTAGIFYCEQGEYELAVKYLTKALLLFQRYDGPDWKAAAAITKKQLNFVNANSRKSSIDVTLSRT